MAGQIIISNIKTDSDNAFSILANTGAVLFSANLASGITTGIADGSVTNAKLAGSITGDKIATGQITGNLLTANCVSGNNIVSGLALTGNVSVTGNVTVGAGTVANPAISVVGDTNTGIYFPAADTIGFSEGGTAVGQFDSSANFKFNSGYGSVATAYGCRAWVNFDGTGTPTIRGSGNVSSITDNGTGYYTINFTDAMPDVNYAVTSGGWSPGAPMTIYSRPNTVSTAILQVYESATPVDDTYARLVIFR